MKFGYRYISVGRLNEDFIMPKLSFVIERKKSDGFVNLESSIVV